jgi:Cu2+-exporting ATPase
MAFAMSTYWLRASTAAHAYGEARINLSTKRLNLRWQGTIKQLKAMARLVEQLGYKLIPYTPDQLLSAGHKIEVDLLKRLFVSAFAFVAMMMILWGVWFGQFDESIGQHTQNLLQVVSALIAIPAIVYSAKPFIVSAFAALRYKKTNMDVPISLAIILTTILSVVETVYNQDQVYFEAAVSLIFFLLIGKYLDIKVRNKVRYKANELVLSLAQYVTIFAEGKYKLIAINKVAPGQIAYVAAGEKIPVDGTLLTDNALIDESLITGESLPKNIVAGERLLAGTINLDSPISLKITAVGEGTVLAEIVKMIENAEQKKSRFVELADRVARQYTIWVIVASTLTTLVWHFYLGVGQGLALWNFSVDHHLPMRPWACRAGCPNYRHIAAYGCRHNYQNSQCP